MGRERQRGAIGVMAAGTLLLALICLALVIDTGRLYFEQRKLQRVADMAALEAATQGGMCGSQLAGDIQGYVIASAAKNGFVPGTGDTLVGTLGSVSFTAGYGSANSQRVFNAGGDLADSVRVQATHSVPSSLVLNVANLFSGASSTTVLSAQAVARRSAIAGISAGSGVLSLDSSNSPLLNALLGSLLGTNLNLDVVTYQGIAGANVSLLALSQQLKAAGVNLELGKIDSLLGANVTAVQLLQAMVNAADSSQLAGVNTALLRTALATINVPTAQLTLGQILTVVAPDSVRDTALNAGVNLLDLLMATALVANKNNAVTIPTQKLALPGLLTQSLSLTVISPPQIAIGYPGRNVDGSWRTQARSSQINLTVRASVDLLNLGLVTSDVTLVAAVAPGSAALESIQCGGVGKPVTVGVQAQPGIATLSLGASVKLVNLGSGYLATADITTPSGPVTVATSTPTELTYTVASPGDLPSSVQRAQSPLGASLGAGLASLSSGLKITVTLGSQGLLCNPLLGWLLCDLGKLVDNLAGTVINSITDLNKLLTKALADLVTALGNALIDPLLKLLGIQTGILDVRLIDLQTGGAELLI
jgi:uncharacterized membrane protein